MIDNTDYDDLEEAGWKMIDKFVYALNHNLEIDQPVLLDIKDVVNHYFALFIIYHESLDNYFKENTEAEFLEVFTTLIFFTFHFSIYLSLISLIILRFSNQIDASLLVIRSMIEKCALAQHLILNPQEYPEWKKGKHVRFTGKNGVISQLLNQAYVESNSKFIHDITLDEKTPDTLLSIYKDFLNVAHNRISELGDFQKIWRNLNSRDDMWSELDDYYYKSAGQFFRMFPIIMDLFTMSLTYNAYLITRGSLFTYSSHKKKINELLNSFPKTKMIFKEKIV